MDSVGLACDRVPVIGISSFRAESRLRLFGDVRKALQGYVRGFRPGTYFEREKLADVIIMAEIVFNREVTQALSFRRQCRLAAATLGLVLCNQLFPLNAVQGLMTTGDLSGFQGPADVQVAQEVYTSLDLALADSLLWSPAAMGSWPFLALLATLAERLAPTAVLGPVGRAWEAWLEAGAWTFTEELTPAKDALQGRNVSCDAELAAAAVTLEAQRMQRAEEEPAAVSTAALNAAHTVVMHCKFLTSLLEPPWAVVWRGLDRLVSARDVRVSVSPDRQSSRTHFSKATRELLARLSEEVTFPMSLHPPHISWSQTAAEEYWFLSDRIRMQGIPHCNDAFMDLMETFDFHRIMRQSSWPTRFVDIGAHLGDCSLWAAARWGRGGGGLQGLAVEHREANAAAIRRAAKMAGLTQGVLRVLTAEAVSQAPCLPSLEVLQTCRSDGQWQGDAVLEFLADYLDLVLVPMVLKRATLREEAVQCPCEHCSSSLQAIHQLQDREVLARLHEANVLSFLGRHLEEAADSLASGDCPPEKYSAAVAASSSLAVLAASARLQDSRLYWVPPGVVRAVAALLKRAVSSGQECAHAVALSLYILRNVAGNHQEVMDTSACSLQECFQQLVVKDGDPASPSLPSQCSAPAAGCLKSSSGTANPQESDEYVSAEGLRGKDADLLKEVPPARSFRCWERLGLLSVTLQALFQSQDSLQSLSISEEEIRQEVGRLAGELRADVPQQRHTRISFQSIRLYLLICRSSHARRQYAILEPQVLEEERRVVAFLLSISTSQHCILLRAMAQDVHSWLLWQSQAFAKQAPKVPEVRKRRSHKKNKPALAEEPKAASGSEEASATAGASASQQVGLFTAGEAIWMAHSFLVLAAAVCLLAYWSSLEHTPASQAAVARNGQLAGYLLYWR